MPPAAMMIEAATSAHNVGAGLGNALGTVRYVQWQAFAECYSGSGIGAHLAAPILMLLASNMADHDRSFTQRLRLACPRAAPASLVEDCAVATAPSTLLRLRPNNLRRAK